ncbi:cytochrome b5 domain-containing protein [Hymenobacter psychrophilus]|uniref:Predicted heme/steroid binding protein n=1 Tax=Hymenobacter psychrophilus TaxID=651662 RepID=A0A1H3MNB3_9BACT|nr:cytochrome b5 domain-containing protein [Hymenobacter psychrophilus]SDY78191.1 Predicted heme/steroid binding protein [Hymenobacter psychrophilus]
MESPEADFEPITGDGRPVAEQPFFTRNQLALRNGQDRDEIWVAFRGLIYDVSRSRLWKRGNHYEHWAGQDLTPEMTQAPHTANVFDRFAVIGQLK